jgi:uncharacterized protein YyaL (SSP411 family)
MELAEEMIQRFSDPAGGFFDTPADGESLLIRPKDIQDNATPSGNALAVEALLKLAALTDRGDFRDIAERSLGQVTRFAVQYPTGFARWLAAGDEENNRALVETTFERYRPNMVVGASRLPVGDEAPALVRDRPLVEGKSTAYVCEGFVCLQPVISPEELVRQLES